MKGAELSKTILFLLKNETNPITFWLISQKIMILTNVSPEKADALRQRIYRSIWKLSDIGLVDITETKYKNKLYKYQVKSK